MPTSPEKRVEQLEGQVNPPEPLRVRTVWENEIEQPFEDWAADQPGPVIRLHWPLPHETGEPRDDGEVDELVER